MSTALFQTRLICVVSIEQPEQAVPLAEALLAGGLNNIEVTFRTAGAAEAITRIRAGVPRMVVGAGTLLTPEQVKAAVDAGAQFGVSPGLSEPVSRVAQNANLPFFPGVATPTEIMRALDLGHKHPKFFPAETLGGVTALKSLIGPFAHTGVKFIPTGGITAAALQNYLALPQVMAVGGSWMTERKLVAEKLWSTIITLTSQAVQLATNLP